MKFHIKLFILIILFFQINCILYAQRISIGIVGGGQVSYSQYYTLLSTTDKNIPYFNTVYGLQVGTNFGKLGISLYTVKLTYSTDISTLKEPSIPRRTFNIKRYPNPALQIGLSLQKPILHTEKASIDLLLSSGINKWLFYIGEIESVKDTFSAFTAYGTANLVIHANAIRKPMNMFLGGGLQASYKLSDCLLYNISIQYQMGLGLLKGMNEKHYTWGDNLGPTIYQNTVTTNGSNLSLRMALMYEFGQ